MVLGCGEEERSPVGPGEPSAEASPAAAVATAVVFQTVSAGTSHACAVATDGRGYCWGGTYGRTPVPVGGALRFIQVRAAIQHTCGLTTTYRVYCWGDNTSGQLGNGSTSQFSEKPVEIAGGRRYSVLRTSSIGGFSCAISQAGATFCWGDNTHGQLGDGTTTLRRSPVRVKGGVTFASVTLGAFHTCGLTAADQAHCWGDNQHGQLGIGNSFEQHLPRAVSGGLTFATLAAGWNHTCGVVGNVAYCWGRNASGQLGDGTRQPPREAGAGVRRASVPRRERGREPHLRRADLAGGLLLGLQLVRRAGRRDRRAGRRAVRAVPHHAGGRERRARHLELGARRRRELHLRPHAGGRQDLLLGREHLPRARRRQRRHRPADAGADRLALSATRSRDLPPRPESTSGRRCPPSASVWRRDGWRTNRRPIALVTGAAHGIGLEVCRQLAERGWTVVLTARVLDRAREAAEPRSRRWRARCTRGRSTWPTDASPRALAADLGWALGRVDVLINNAAAAADWSETAGTADLRDAHAAMETNLFGPWRVIQAFLPLLRRSRHGRIVNVSSGAGSHVDPQFGLAAAPRCELRGVKAALNALTVKLALELLRTGSW